MITLLTYAVLSTFALLWLMWLSIALPALALRVSEWHICRTPTIRVTDNQLERHLRLEAVSGGARLPKGATLLLLLATLTAGYLHRIL